MMIEKLYLLFVCLLVIIGLIFIRRGFFQHKGYIRFQTRPDHWIQNILLVLKDQNSDEVFQAVGIHLSMAKYTAIRNLVAVCAIVVICIQMAVQGFAAVKVPLCVAMLLYLVTYPAESFGKGKSTTPFRLVLDKLKESRLEARDNELTKIVAQLKNLLLTQENSWAADYIIEILMRYTKTTKPIFAQTLSYMRLGDMDQAYQYFKNNFGTKLGNNFAEILLKLNALEPVEFLKQVETFQNTMKEERRTKRLKKQDAAAKKMFFLASILISIIFIDYMYVVFAYLFQQMSSF